MSCGVNSSPLPLCLGHTPNYPQPESSSPLEQKNRTFYTLLTHLVVIKHKHNKNTLIPDTKAESRSFARDKDFCPEPMVQSERTLAPTACHKHTGEDSTTFYLRVCYVLSLFVSSYNTIETGRVQLESVMRRVRIKLTLKNNYI